MWMSKVPSSTSLEPLDRVDRPIQPIGQARPGLAEPIVERYLGSSQRREGDALVREGAPDPADQSTQGAGSPS
jgi:hypothetical protein